mgnify:CR=1 FL=1
MKNFAKSKINPDLKYVYSENNALSIVFQSNELLLGVLGEFNNNLKELEKITNTSIYSRGNSILLKNTPEKNEIIKNAIQFLVDQFLSNGTLEKKDIESSVNKFMIDEKNTNKSENIEYIIKTPKKSVIPRSEKQKNYIRALKESDIVISAGPAGTGKTFLAVAVALTMLLEKKIERIILSRPAVEAGENLGFLPGDMKDKVDPYLRPIYDALYEMMPFEIVEKKIQEGIIEIAPVAFMRGRTFKNSFIIIDEAQNTSSIQMKMILTRLGYGSKMIINGDLTQIDIKYINDSGLSTAKNKLSNLKTIKFINLNKKDVVRHKIVSEIISAYEKR